MRKHITDNIPSGNIDYIGIYDTETLKPVDTIKNEALLAAAIKIGKARLIDNVLATKGLGG